MTALPRLAALYFPDHHAANPVGFRNILVGSAVKKYLARPLDVQFVAAAITRLRSQINPSTIIGSVVPVIVNAINRFIFVITRAVRPLAESCEIVPIRADRNASPAVSCVTFAVRVSAALSHASPNVVKPRAAFAMTTHGVAKRPSPDAPATRRVARANPICGDFASDAAIALPFPNDSVLNPFCCGAYADKATVALSSVIFRQFMHGKTIHSIRA